MKINRFLSVLLAAVVVLGAFALSASAEIKDATKDVTLTIYALKAEDSSEYALDSAVTGEKIIIDGRKPLEGASFRLYKLENDEIQDPDVYIKTPLTDQNGCVSIVIPAAEQGRYRVVEDDKPANAAENTTTIPFDVDLPMTDPLGTGFLYEVFAYPKQEIKTSPTPYVPTEPETDTDDTDVHGEDDDIIPTPEVSKLVSGDNGKTWGERANISSVEGQRAYWKVISKIPYNIKRMRVFRVGDVLDDRLIPPEASEVKASINGKELPASSYTVTVKDKTITVSFKEHSLDDYANKAVDVIFPTAIDLESDKSIGEMIKNMATLTFSRIKGESESDSDSLTGSDDDDKRTKDSDTDGADPTPTTTITTTFVEVWTGEIDGFKHDNDNNAVAGAEFTLYSDKDCKNEIAKTVSDSKGVFVFKGLKDGTFYLKETKVPDGYQVNNNVLEVTVEKFAKEPVKVDVVNIKKTNLPVTGGAGIIGMSITGFLSAIMGIAFITLALKLRRRAKAALA